MFPFLVNQAFDSCRLPLQVINLNYYIKKIYQNSTVLLSKDVRVCTEWSMQKTSWINTEKFSNKT